MQTILLVDDEEEMRKKYKKLLEDEQYRVIEAPDALEVTNILMREKSNIDLIILDIQMPNIDGREIFEIIDQYAPSIQVIVSSVLPLQEQKLRISRATDFYNKSHKPETLLGKIKNILGIEEHSV